MHLKLLPLPSLISLAYKSSPERIISKAKNRDDCSKPTDQNAFKVCASTKCYRCQGYDYVAAKCGREIKTAFIDRVPTEAPYSDFEEFANQRG